VVVPSIAEEALGLVALEAFAGGRPVVATAVGGLADVVDDAVGWLAEPTVDGLASVLVDAASADVVTKGRAARARYDDKYSTARMVQGQLDIYRSVIAARAGTRRGASRTDPPG
jgi:glycosyltransferase involved in cell wall biosynthesis